MTITSELVRSVASMYTVEQLQEKIAGLITDLETNGSSIISASTGAGASYTRKIEASREDLLLLYQAALEYKMGIVSKGGDIYPVQFNSVFNR